MQGFVIKKGPSNKRIARVKRCLIQALYSKNDQAIVVPTPEIRWD